jgi:hypothetical protein
MKGSENHGSTPFGALVMKYETVERGESLPLLGAGIEDSFEP